jgi:hypothetical protein
MVAARSAAMTFIRRKVNKKTGKIYLSLEDRVRVGGKVKSVYIRSLSAAYWMDRSAHEPVGVHDTIVETFERQHAPEKAAEAPAPAAMEKSTGEAPAADPGQENAASGSEGGKR